MRSSAFSFVCDTLLGLFLCLWWKAALSRWGTDGPSAHALARAGGLYCTAVFLPRELGILVTAGALAVVAARMPHALDSSIERGRAARDEHRDYVKHLFLGVVTGCALEEIWRGLYWFSFMPAALTFFLLVGMASAFVMFKRRRNMRLPILLASLALVTVFCVNREVAPMLLAGLSLLLLLSTHYSRAGAADDRRAAFSGMALGLIGSCIMFNYIAVIFTYDVSIFGVYGTQTGFELATVFLSALLFSATGGYLGWAIIKQARMAEVERQQEVVVSEAGLVRDILLAYDLTPLQVDTATLLLRGRTVAQISSELHYAPSTIKAARRVCLERAHVSDVSALREQIIAGIRCSQQSSQQ